MGHFAAVVLEEKLFQHGMAEVSLVGGMHVLTRKVEWQVLYTVLKS